MPIYEFICTNKKCDHIFEEICDFEKRKKVKCPKCNKKGLPLLSFPAAVIFKEPKGTSRENNFEYVAKANYENAVRTREAAQRANKGSQPYTAPKRNK